MKKNLTAEKINAALKAAEGVILLNNSYHSLREISQKHLQECPEFHEEFKKLIFPEEL